MTPLTVTVHGATGLQGGSVVRALSRSGNFSVRAIVRNLESPKARDLLTMPSVTLVKAELLDKTSLRHAYTGADAVYACTPNDDNYEEIEGKNMADAALEARVSLFLWANLESAEEKSNGLIRVDHADMKHKVSLYIQSLNLPFVFIYLPWFMENYTNFQGISAAGDELHLTMTGIRVDAKLYVGADLGRAVQIVLENMTAFTNQRVYLAPFAYTQIEQAQIVQQITGKKTVAKFTPMPDELQDLVNMCTFFHAFGCYGDVPLQDPLLSKYGFEPTPFEEYVRKDVIPFLGLE